MFFASIERVTFQCWYFNKEKIAQPSRKIKTGPEAQNISNHRQSHSESVTRAGGLARFSPPPRLPASALVDRCRWMNKKCYPVIIIAQQRKPNSER
ncbi:MAG: hypothetical protein EBU88_14925 [Acidobacteria bacterium]|nr:hypothetical protein [Acidobacteriota bacterium]